MVLAPDTPERQQRQQRQQRQPQFGVQAPLQRSSFVNVFDSAKQLFQNVLAACCKKYYINHSVGVENLQQLSRAVHEHLCSAVHAVLARMRDRVAELRQWGPESAQDHLTPSMFQMTVRAIDFCQNWQLAWNSIPAIERGMLLLLQLIV